MVETTNKFKLQDATYAVYFTSFPAVVNNGEEPNSQTIFFLISAISYIVVSFYKSSFTALLSAQFQSMRLLC